MEQLKGGGLVHGGFVDAIVSAVTEIQYFHL